MRLKLAVGVLIMAAGVLAISLAYAAGRAGSASGAWVAAYWLGEAIIFAPLVWRVVSGPPPADAEAIGLVIGLAIATYLVKYAYSPLSFRFPDELEHWRSARTLLSSHHLFGVNYLLPVSPGYPGLEEVTTSLASMSGLSVFSAGLIVAGLSHVLFSAALYVLFRQVSGSARIALAGSAIYATNPHYQVFDAIFSYQTLALAFFGLALITARWLAADLDGPGRTGRTGLWGLAVVFGAATVVTHHVTSYMLTLTLLLIAVTGAVLRQRARRHGAEACRSRVIQPAVLAGIYASLVAAWIALVVPYTISYLAPVVTEFTDGLVGAFTAQVSASGATPAGPLGDRLAEYAATALIMVTVPFGWLRIWRTQRRNAWAVALGVGAAAYYVLAVLRVTTPSGAQFAGRSMTFLYIPVSYVIAMALDRPGRSIRLGRVLVRARPILAATGAGILLAGGLASGWPPYWERLPGKYAVDGFESGVTNEGIAAADWARAVLGPGNRIAADFTNYVLMGSYGDQNVVTGVDQLYCSKTWTPADARLARLNAVRYLVVDLRMSEYIPPSGSYFISQSSACQAPMPRQDLAKFGSVPGMNRLYDSGNIIVYSLGEG